MAGISGHMQSKGPMDRPSVATLVETLMRRSKGKCVRVWSSSTPLVSVVTAVPGRPGRKQIWTMAACPAHRRANQNTFAAMDAAHMHGERRCGGEVAAHLMVGYCLQQRPLVHIPKHERTVCHSNKEPFTDNIEAHRSNPASSLSWAFQPCIESRNAFHCELGPKHDLGTLFGGAADFESPRAATIGKPAAGC